MKLIFLGPPGAGKGTQAERICDEYAIAHISTGEILRGELRAKSELGCKAQSFIDKGELVPDEVMIGIVEKRIQEPDCAKGFLLDGFPRTQAQAEALEKLVAVDRVINLDVPLDMLTERITGRRVCRDCGATYHVSSLAVPDAACRCGGQLYQRDDDQRETVVRRLSVYQQQTAPLIAYYQGKGLIADIDGDRSVGDVFADIANVLEKFR